MSISQMLGLRPVYRWTRPGRFGSPFYSELHTSHSFPDGQMYWQGTEICWLGTRPLSDHDEFIRAIGTRVRVGLAARLPAATRNMTVVTEPTTTNILQSLSVGDTTHLDSALLRARAYSG